MYQIARHSHLRTERGAALIISILVMAVLSVIGAGAMLVSNTNQKIAGNYRGTAQTFNVAEAGIHKAIAEIKNDVIWRGDGTTYTHTGTLTLLNQTATYTVTTSDATTDSTIPGGYIKISSTGTFGDSTQSVECFVTLSPDSLSNADSPDKAVITSGDNTGSGSHVVNGYDDDGNLDPSMVDTYVTLPTVNQDALKAFADYSFASLENGEVDSDLAGQTNFFKDHPTDNQPYIIHVSGNLSISGNRHVYGIIFVEGTTVTLSGSVRIHGVIYAPNATVSTTINGGGSPGDQPVMGQVIAGTGGVDASGNHADVQLVTEYVDAFNNYGGANVNVDIAPGSWRQL